MDAETVAALAAQAAEITDLRALVTQLEDALQSQGNPGEVGPPGDFRVRPSGLVVPNPNAGEGVFTFTEEWELELFTILVSAGGAGAQEPNNIAGTEELDVEELLAHAECTPGGLLFIDKHFTEKRLILVLKGTATLSGLLSITISGPERRRENMSCELYHYYLSPENYTRVYAVPTGAGAGWACQFCSNYRKSTEGGGYEAGAFHVTEEAHFATLSKIAAGELTLIAYRDKYVTTTGLTDYDLVRGPGAGSPIAPVVFDKPPNNSELNLGESLPQIAGFAGHSPAFGLLDIGEGLVLASAQSIPSQVILS